MTAIEELTTRLERSTNLCTEVAKGEMDRHPETALVMRGRAAAYREALTWVWELFPAQTDGATQPTPPDEL